MGDRLTDGSGEPQTDQKSYGDIFDELFPHYLLFGMTPEQYWDGESGLKPAFRKAYQLRIENERRIADRDNWYMGQYIMAALQCVPLLVGGLNVKNTSKLPDYPEKPFLETYEEEKKEKTRQQQQENQQQFAMAMFQAMAMQFNRNMESKGKQSGSK